MGANFEKLDGGSDDDVPRIDGTGWTLELTQISNNRVESIETLDLTPGAGNYTVKLNKSDVLDLNNNENRMFIIGGAGEDRGRRLEP